MALFFIPVAAFWHYSCGIPFDIPSGIPFDISFGILFGIPFGIFSVWHCSLWHYSALDSFGHSLWHSFGILFGIIPFEIPFDIPFGISFDTRRQASVDRPESATFRVLPPSLDAAPRCSRPGRFCSLARCGLLQLPSQPTLLRQTLGPTLLD